MDQLAGGRMVGRKVSGVHLFLTACRFDGRGGWPFDHVGHGYGTPRKSRRPTLSSENDIDAGEKQFQLGARKFAHALRKKTLIHSHNLRDVGHGIPGKAGQTGRERDVPWSARPAKVTG